MATASRRGEPSAPIQATDLTCRISASLGSLTCGQKVCYRPGATSRVQGSALGTRPNATAGASGWWNQPEVAAPRLPRPLVSFATLVAWSDGLHQRDLSQRSARQFY
jgi:hypothetical protein